MHRRTALVAALAVTVVTLGAVQLAPGAAPSARAAGLTSYSGCAELLAAYRAELERSATTGILGWPERVFSVTAGVPAAGSSAARDSAATGAVGSGPTGTNLQEQGVDEPDLAKLRDGRLVVLSGARLKVVSAEARPRLLGSLTLPADQVYGGELLLVGDRAVVVIPGWRQDPQAGHEGGERRMLMPLRPGTPTTEVVLVDLSGDQPRLLERSTYDGQYVSARLVGGTLRLVTTTRPQPVVVYPTEAGAVAEHMARLANEEAAAQVGLADVLPQVVRRGADGTVLEHGAAVACDQTFHAPHPSGASTLLVTTLRPGDGLAATDRTAVTTDGDLVYAAEDRLYVATSRWGTVAPMFAVDDAGAAAGRSLPEEVRTEIHAFDTTSDTGTEYVGSGSVPGYVLGRWALSRYDGALRVATTRQPPWDATATDRPTGAGTTSSMVVKLVERDGALVETGRVAGLGRGEQIRAVRYFGDIAAVVTFRQTDPLYLLDLSGTPQVLGELKVPGFSTYLHPLGNGLLMGLGQDATSTGQVSGVQVSVFDVSDLAHPVLRDRLRLGEGWSAASDDSRAFGYDPAQRLATFPFTSYDPSGDGGRERPGAIGVSVAEDGTLRLVGRLDTTAGSWPQRVLSDGERVYAVTETGVVAGDARTMGRTGELALGG
jgi:uncharacterized secreted protein with C-terminal beta-propeller domain